MERISLPRRTVSTQALKVGLIGVGLIAMMIGWVVWFMYVDAARHTMSEFRQVVMTRRNIRIIEGRDVVEERTLFRKGGKMKALRGDADRAFQHMDPWNGEMAYTYARALWREFNTKARNLADPGGLAVEVPLSAMTPGGFQKKTLPETTLWALRQAVRSDPTNVFYRATLAGVLSYMKDMPGADAEVASLLEFHSPRNAYGQIWTAKMLAKRGGNKGRIREHYYRALIMVSSDVTAGLHDPRVKTEPFLPLGAALVTDAVDGLMDNVGPYKLWAAELPDYPEVHWMVADSLYAKGKLDEVSLERDKVTKAVERRLKRASGSSTIGTLFDVLIPLRTPRLSGRQLLNREIGYAANLLVKSGELDRAIELYEIQIAQAPDNVGARLAYGELLFQKAKAIGSELSSLLRSRDNETDEERGARMGRAAVLRADIQKRYAEVDEQVSEILGLKPRMPKALYLRHSLPRPSEGEEPDTFGSDTALPRPGP